MFWSIDDSNKRAVDFYEKLGAKIDDKSSLMSLSGDAFEKVVSHS